MNRRCMRCSAPALCQARCPQSSPPSLLPPNATPSGIEGFAELPPLPYETSPARPSQPPPPPPGPHGVGAAGAGARAGPPAGGAAPAAGHTVYAVRLRVIPPEAPSEAILGLFPGAKVSPAARRPRRRTPRTALQPAGRPLRFCCARWACPRHSPTQSARSAPSRRLRRSAGCATARQPTSPGPSSTLRTQGTRAARWRRRTRAACCCAAGHSLQSRPRRLALRSRRRSSSSHRRRRRGSGRRAAPTRPHSWPHRRRLRGAQARATRRGQTGTGSRHHPRHRRRGRTPHPASLLCRSSRRLPCCTRRHRRRRQRHRLRRCRRSELRSQVATGAAPPVPASAWPRAQARPSPRPGHSPEAAASRPCPP
jgi:hypothetical protein